MAEPAWWQSAVVYEIVVPSFQDSNGDGWGDLAGITRRIDYLQDLGVDALWLTPINRSPMVDIGYDVSDFIDVEPRYGTLSDFDSLVAAAHAHAMRVIIDFVPNHTSVHHSWFRESQQSRLGPKADWYLWSDAGPAGSPPNNWVNRFGDNAWTWEDRRQQFYFGSFTPSQPDLNWRNLEVRQAIFDALRFWLQRGVDGIRVDALAHLIKDAALRNNPPNLSYGEGEPPSVLKAMIYNQNQPELLDVISEMRHVIDEFDNRLLMGEVYQSPEQITAYQRAGAHLLMSTSMLQTDFDALHVRNMVDFLEGRTAVGAWPARSSGNHDLSRLAGRVGQENLRLAALLQFTVRGTPTMYYGEELGLRNVNIPADRMRDPSGKRDPTESRDGSRAPMPWDRGRNAGFSDAEAWLPSDAATAARNVLDQSSDPDSLLNFYRRLLAFRKTQPALLHGSYAPLDVPAPIFAFTRRQAESHLLVVSNFSDSEARLDISQLLLGATNADVLLSTDGTQRASPSPHIRLGPRQGIIANLQESRA